jgi:hypothetical protein
LYKAGSRLRLVDGSETLQMVDKRDIGRLAYPNGDGPCIPVDKSLGLYRQCSGGKLFETVEPGGAGALPIRRFVLNPLWGFNCKLIYQKELNNHGRGGRRASGIALHSTPAQAG